MKYGSSVRVRHIVGRIEKGEEFIDTLRRLCLRENIHTATFSAIGSFTSAELQEILPLVQTPQIIFKDETPLRIERLHGNITTMGGEIIINTTALLKYKYFGQYHRISGLLVSAKSYDIELALTMFDDLCIERSFDTNTGLVTFSKFTNSLQDDLTLSDSSFRIEEMQNRKNQNNDSQNASLSQTPKKEPQVFKRKSTNTPAIPPDLLLQTVDENIDIDEQIETNTETNKNDTDRSSWQKAIRKANIAQANATAAVVHSFNVHTIDEDNDPQANQPQQIHTLKQGYILDHPSLGQCHVSKVEGNDWVYIKILETGHIKKLALKLFNIIPNGKIGEKLRFTLEKKD